MGVYIFPERIAKFMKEISPRTQMEASMMAMMFILAGLMFMSIFIWFTETSLTIKIFTLVNGIAGLAFLGSMLVTTFQQYVTYLTAIGSLLIRQFPLQFLK